VDDEGDIRVQYGDQGRHWVYHYWPGWRKRVNRVLRRQIRRHDRQSLKAKTRSDVVDNVKAELALTNRDGYWGTEIIKQKAGR
jgi:hypothetical protein